MTKSINTSRKLLNKNKTGLNKIELSENFHIKSTKPIIEGNGKKNIICFHGFGQNPKVYSKLTTKESDCTLYSFPLPKALEGINLIYNYKSYKEGYFKSLKKFIQENQIKQFEIVSFSIGAKVGLCLAEEFPSMVNKVTLLAPDGIVKRFIYQIATNNLLGRLLFFFIINHSFFFVIYLSQVVSGFKIIPKSLNQLIKYYFSDKEKRVLIFNTWLNCRYFIPNLKVLKSRLDNSVTLELILASKDKIIKKKHTLPFLKIFPNTNVEVLPTTHEKLISAWINSLK